MNHSDICIIKRDGKEEKFSIGKIKNAITKAFHATDIMNKEELIFEITMKVIERIFTSRISVEEIQDLVETELIA
ncbi:hypothetical protein EZS27_021303 [termite gut metagenome]|uniref:ATP-cone domain-containing protein n=1 Tax=termite gut metagenome TaxID=433724 RepID=A0A5J4R8I4_9ZZZZ